jgi:hypothetical protein
MIRNYLKITFRTLLKHKGFSMINIFGLALTMSISLMIIIFIKDQRSSDRFHEKRGRIARTYTTEIKVKEIGIRKVLGANVSNVAFMLSKNSLKLILYSAVFLFPERIFFQTCFTSLSPSAPT